MQYAIRSKYRLGKIDTTYEFNTFVEAMQYINFIKNNYNLKKDILIFNYINWDYDINATNLLEINIEKWLEKTLYESLYLERDSLFNQRGG